MFHSKAAKVAFVALCVFVGRYGITHPDGDAPLGSTRMPAQLQYMAAQQTRNEEVLTNWSGTHKACPK